MTLSESPETVHRKVLDVKSRRRAFRFDPEFSHRLDTLDHFRESAQLVGLCVAQPQAPAFVALEEFVRADPAPEEACRTGFPFEKLGSFFPREQVPPGRNRRADRPLPSDGRIPERDPAVRLQCVLSYRCRCCCTATTRSTANCSSTSGPTGDTTCCCGFRQRTVPGHSSPANCCKTARNTGRSIRTLRRNGPCHRKSRRRSTASCSNTRCPRTSTTYCRMTLRCTNRDHSIPPTNCTPARRTCTTIPKARSSRCSPTPPPPPSVQKRPGISTKSILFVSCVYLQCPGLDARDSQGIQFDFT